MVTSHAVWLIIALTSYCLVNSLLLTKLLLRFGVKTRRIDLLKDILLKTAASICIVIALFYFIAKMFCWTAWLMQCLECVCLSASLDRVSAQGVSDHILFTFLVAVVQLILLRIPPQLSRLTFCALVGISNVCAMLAIAILALVWPV